MRSIKQNNLILGCLCALGCEIIFGLSYIFTKTATEKAGAFALLGWRFFIAVVIMSVCIMLGLIEVNLKGKPIKPLLLVAIFNPCIYFVGETIGISNTTASESGVFLACIPVASLLASTLMLKKKPYKIQITGILITLVGVTITVFAVGASSSLSVVGYIFLFMAVISYALYSVFVEKAADYTGMEITYIMLLIGAIIFGLIAICEALLHGTVGELVALPFKESAFAIAVLYQGIGSSIVAFFLSNMAIAKIGVNRTSSFIGVATVVSIIAGAILLEETFTIYQIIGAIVIVIGVYTANGKSNNVTYKELMIKSLSDLLEDGETLLYPIYGTLIQKNLHWFGYFGLTEQHLLIALLQGSSKEISWTSRVPLDIKKVTVKRKLIPFLFILYIEFNEGETGKFLISKKVHGIESQEENFKGFVDFIQKRKNDYKN